MNVKIMPGKLHGSVAAIPSKSHAQRVLIAAAVSDAPTVIHMGNLPDTKSMSKDIQSVIGALTSLGAKIKADGSKIVVSPAEFQRIQTKPFDAPVINCGESGTAARLLLPLAAVLYESAVIDGIGSLKGRPFQALCDAMEQNGCTFESKRLPVVFHGHIRSGQYVISGSESSQYISALMFALPLLKGDSTLTLTSPLQSSGYVDMTVEALKLFGVNTGYAVRGGQRYRTPGHIMAEGDWSNAAFWHAAGVTVTGLKEDSLQKDKVFMEIKDQNQIDIADIPDLAPVLSVCCAAKTGDTRITSIKRLRLKESDRVSSIVCMLQAFGVNVSVEEDEMIIHGTGKLRGGTIDGMNDHRIVMSAAVASCFCKEEITITGAQAAEKSYAGFFKDFNQLGGKAVVL